LKCNQRLIEAISLPVSLRLLPITGMASKTKDEIVVSPILRGLIAVAPAVAFAQTRSVDQRETQRVVVRFIGAVFAVGKHGHTVSSALVGKIEPLVRSNFKFLFIIVAALHCTDIPIVGCLWIRRCQWECGF